MGGLLAKPITTKETEDGGDHRGLAFGVSAMQGWREGMEDAHMAIPDFDSERQLGLFGVFDGHGGSAVAKVVAATFPATLKRQKSFIQGQYSEALYQTFLAVDDFLDSAKGREEVERVLAAAPPVERDVEEEELRPGPFRTCPGANHPVRAKGEDVGSGWSQEALLSGAGWEALGESTRSFRELYGFPATLAWAALQLKDLPPARHVEVWIIGARSGMEGWLAEEGSWDFLIEIFPTSSWKLCLIGPEMREDLRLGARVEVESARLQGHEWIQKDGLCPDLVVCFNSGIGTLSLSITKPWLLTVAALLKLDVPILFTCFGLKERKGEEFLLRGLFKARVLVDFLENPFRQRPGDRPGCYRSLEEESLSAPEGEAELCNAQLWWAQGSQLSAEELDQVALKAPKVLEELTQSYALQGAHRSWILALKEGNRRVGEAAVENFQIAFNNVDVLRALSKFAKHIADAMVSFIRRHGPHPKAKQCVGKILLAKVRRMLPEGHDDQELSEAVTERMREDYADVFGTAERNSSLRDFLEH
ncbi:unnamed protein product [Cladocopium goreaui]|uniref:Mitochondrial splicing suppressor 51-like C-terminal domain-containing protein n=1 Tax=Cladocopium goreaui TaxID=2562237 RepID=A0A9P1G1E1_9DINO|nr:unnamed protein product [Cladocopium goreaui]